MDLTSDRHDTSTSLDSRRIQTFKRITLDLFSTLRTTEDMDQSLSSLWTDDPSMNNIYELAVNYLIQCYLPYFNFDRLNIRELHHIVL